MEPDPTIIDIPEVEKAHRDVWLAFEVLEVDERRHAKRGRLLAKDASRKRVSEAIRAHGAKHFYVTFSGEKIPRDRHFVLL